MSNETLVVRNSEGKILLTILDWAKHPSELKKKLQVVVGRRAQLVSISKRRPAVVTDVDETLLRQSPYDDDDFVCEPLGAWLFTWCLRELRKFGMKGHIITARPGAVESKNFLLQQLQKAGFRDPAVVGPNGKIDGIGKKPPDGFDSNELVRVFMRPHSHHDISKTKEFQRALVRDAGDIIILTIGDQLGDHLHLEGHDAELCEERFCPFTYYVFCAGEPTPDSVICVKTPEKLGNWPTARPASSHHRSADESNKTYAK